MDDYKSALLVSQIPLNLQFGSDVLSYNATNNAYSVTLRNNMKPCYVSLNRLSFNTRFVTIISTTNAILTITNNSNVFTTTLNVGSWSFNDLANYIQQQQVLNGIFLINNLNQIWVPITVALSPSNDNAVLTINPVPSSLPVNWTNPSSLTLTGNTPQITLSAGLANLLGGFSTAITPTSTTQNFSSTILSPNTPSNLYFNFKLRLMEPMNSNPYIPVNAISSLFQGYCNFAVDGSVSTFEPLNRSWFYLGNERNQTFRFMLTNPIGTPLTLASNDIFISMDCIFSEKNIY